MTKTYSPNYGGKRPGAGRPVISPDGEPTKPVTISLPPSMRDAIAELDPDGKGSVSRAIRFLYENHQVRTEEKETAKGAATV